VARPGPGQLDGRAGDGKRLHRPGDERRHVRIGSPGQQYQCNWSTKAVATGYYYRLGVELDDGQVDVNLGLR
jgi:hypothetical protein